MLASYGELFLARGDTSKAIAYADECQKLAEQTESPKNVVKARRLRGQAFQAEGRLDEAATELLKALELARSMNSAGQSWRTAAALGHVRKAKGDAGGASAAYGEALAVIDGIASNFTDEELRNVFLQSEAVSRIRESAEV